jgi:hypothetical protein
MQVGFFVVKTSQMIEIETVNMSRSDIALTATLMAAQWKKKHRIPSPLWCAWGEDFMFIYTLNDVHPSEKVLEAIKVFIDSMPAGHAKRREGYPTDHTK